LYVKIVISVAVAVELELNVKRAFIYCPFGEQLTPAKLADTPPQSANCISMSDGKMITRRESLVYDDAVMENLTAREVEAEFIVLLGMIVRE